MKNPRAYKIQDVNRKTRKGVVAQSLADLRTKGIEKLGLDKKGCRVCTEDGTEVDDEEYFQSLPAQTVFVFVGPHEEWEGYVTILKQATEKVFNALSHRDKIVENIHSFMMNGESDEIYCIMAEVVNRLKENIDAEERDDDEAWFEGLRAKYQTKGAALKATAQSRIRNYFSKTKEFVESAKQTRSKKAATLLLDVLEDFKEELRSHDFFGDYFVRSGDERIRLCCPKGWFDCQGEYNVDQCTKLHRINPYGSKESRILFSTWNLDHVIEKSRQVLPALLEAAEKCPKGKQLNSKYFFQLLFTLENLKLVHIGCHEKGEHTGYECDKRKYYAKL